MAALKDDQKLFIVQALACFDAPSQVIEAVKQEFGIDVSPQQLQAYNPATKAGARMSQKLKDIFESTRKRFLAEVSDIPVANQAYRLRQLQRMVHESMKRKNIVLAASLLEQAAKESGGMFTNKRELSGPGGKPMEHRTVVVDEKSVAAAVSALEDEY
ncbi:DUF2280 domain-containing protein [Alcaligenes sp. RM2]